ncbi:hypothetical protein M758_UG329200 [Ceratodon purpureus]|nr:hypothetical protein M758_UG329200 [Ceratodon purpureus]
MSMCVPADYQKGVQRRNNWTLWQRSSFKETSSVNTSGMRFSMITRRISCLQQLTADLSQSMQRHRTVEAAGSIHCRE